jgi:hypothetical protein
MLLQGVSAANEGGKDIRNIAKAPMVSMWLLITTAWSQLSDPVFGGKVT